MAAYSTGEEEVIIGQDSVCVCGGGSISAPLSFQGVAEALMLFRRSKVNSVIIGNLGHAFLYSLAY